MPENALTQGFLFLLYGATGCGFGLLFHILSLPLLLFPKMRWLSILQDILFWLVFTAVVYVLNYNFTHGQIHGYTLLAMALGVALVRMPIAWVGKKVRKKVQKR